jgi:hypothetical protein
MSDEYEVDPAAFEFTMPVWVLVDQTTAANIAATGRPYGWIDLFASTLILADRDPTDGNEGTMIPVFTDSDLGMRFLKLSETAGMELARVDTRQGLREWLRLAEANGVQKAIFDSTGSGAPCGAIIEIGRMIANLV